MNEGDAFLRAVAESPDDDAPRLVYADWLEERNHAERAEFIRIQCELARPEGARSRRTELRLRERELLKRYRADWSREISPATSVKYTQGPDGQISTDAAALEVRHGIKFLRDVASIANVNYRRGFGEQISTDATPMLEYAISPNMVGIVRDVQLTGVSFPQIVMAISKLNGASVLRLTSINLNDDQLRQVLRTDFPPSVRTLDLRWNDLSEDSIQSLRDARITQFDNIYLGGNHFRSAARAELAHRHGHRVSFEIDRPKDYQYLLSPTGQWLTGLDSDYRQVILMYVGHSQVRLIAYCFDLDGLFLGIEEYPNSGRTPGLHSQAADDLFMRTFAARLGLVLGPVEVCRFYHPLTGIGIQDFTAAQLQIVDDPPDVRDPTDPWRSLSGGHTYSYLKTDWIPHGKFEFGELGG